MSEDSWPPNFGPSYVFTALTPINIPGDSPAITPKIKTTKIRHKVFVMMSLSLIGEDKHHS
jgi:hypothetical protein